jgi:hypothetical protein
VVILGADIYLADGIGGLSGFALVTPKSYTPISRQSPQQVFPLKGCDDKQELHMLQR